MSDFFASLCGRRRIRLDDDHEALLAQYDDETTRQRALHEKLHTYQMVRALSMGFLPSNEQLVVLLRTLLATDVLNPDNPDLSDSGRRLVRYGKQWLHAFIELLVNKNSKDQLQDLIWFLLQARVTVDAKDIARRAQKTTAKDDIAAGTLLLTNADFRLFLSDVNTIGRQVLADTSFSFSKQAEKVGQRIEPSQAEAKTLSGPGADRRQAPTSPELEEEAHVWADAVGEGLSKTKSDAVQSAKEHLSGDEKDTIMYRLKQAVLKLRKRPDYNESVHTIGLLIKQYATAYSRSADRTIEAIQEDVQTNDELDRAAQNAWSLLSSFGDQEEWAALEGHLRKVFRHAEKDSDFEKLMGQVGDSVQRMFQDPSFFDSIEDTFEELKDKAGEVGSADGNSIRHDIDNLLNQLRRTVRSVMQDPHVAALLSVSKKIAAILLSGHPPTRAELINDVLEVFIPLAINAIQHLPIPRLEVSSPAVDLLLENLILEPGKTVNASSFLPYRLAVSTRNDIEVRRTHARTTATDAQSLTTIKIDGLSMKADDIGYWISAHKGLLHLRDSGIASFALDRRGIDIHLDVEIGRERLEDMLSLRDVRVKIHHLNYTLRRSKFTPLLWLLKPILRPLVRKALESHIAAALKDLFHFLNRELVFARERLRATRIASPEDVYTFVRAVLARLAPAADPDVQATVGVQPELFRGKFAPGSLVKVWEEEARRARERVEDWEREGWRNDVFDVNVRAVP